jgi:hypothetical protein
MVASRAMAVWLYKKTQFLIILDFSCTIHDILASSSSLLVFMFLLQCLEILSVTLNCSYPLDAELVCFGNHLEALPTLLEKSVIGRWAVNRYCSLVQLRLHLTLINVSISRWLLSEHHSSIALYFGIDSVKHSIFHRPQAN